MAFPPAFLEELRNRVSLAGLIGRNLKLIRHGREYAGLCPFHHEKTPSFYVVEDKSFFHCFGCGAHGDAIGYLMRAQHLDFLEAVERLSAEVGLAVPRATAEERERAQRQKTLLEALEAAARFYEDRLWSAGGSHARDYLVARGLDDDTMRRFRLGWAPDERQALHRALAAEMPDALLIEAGLLHLPDSGEPYDFLRGRVVFPIGDRAGRVIAFGGRTLGDGQPKYLNSPEHPLFEKGRVLYGWSAARAAKGGAPDPIVTEGYMDVIALHRAGFETAVAPLGTALGEFQLRELWRLGPEPVLCFDGDTAGRRAALRALHRALPLLRPGFSLRFAALPAGEDPDSLVRSGGAPAFERVLAAAVPLADMLWESEVGGARRDTPERLAAIRARLLDHTHTIIDRTVRLEFETLYKARCSPWAARRSGRRAVRDGPPPPPRASARVQRQILLRILLDYPELIDEVAETLAALEIPEPGLDKLRRELLGACASSSRFDAPALRQHLLQNGFAATVDGLFLPSIDTGFLARRSDPSCALAEWAHVADMLTREEPTAVAVSGNQHLLHFRG